MATLKHKTRGQGINRASKDPLIINYLKRTANQKRVKLYFTNWLKANKLIEHTYSNRSLPGESGDYKVSIGAMRVEFSPTQPRYAIYRVTNDTSNQEHKITGLINLTEIELYSFMRAFALGLHHKSPNQPTEN